MCARVCSEQCFYCEFCHIFFLILSRGEIYFSKKKSHVAINWSITALKQHHRTLVSWFVVQMESFNILSNWICQQLPNSIIRKVDCFEKRLFRWVRRFLFNIKPLHAKSIIFVLWVLAESHLICNWSRNSSFNFWRKSEQLFFKLIRFEKDKIG